MSESSNPSRFNFKNFLRKSKAIGLAAVGVTKRVLDFAKAPVENIQSAAAALEGSKFRDPASRMEELKNALRVGTIHPSRLKKAYLTSLVRARGLRGHERRAFRKAWAAKHRVNKADATVMVKSSWAGNRQLSPGQLKRQSNFLSNNVALVA